MLYTKDEYKKVFNDFFDRNGIIIKLLDVNSTSDKILGYITRMEVENNEMTAYVIINISTIKKYIKHEDDDKKFSYKNFKYFSIKHLFNKLNKIKKLNKIPIDINDHHSIKSYIDNFEINNEDIIKYMLNIIENTKKYYKNKEIKLFLI